MDVNISNHILQTPPNYFRALQWAAVTTFVTHIDPSFSTVFGIEAVNEPLMDPSQTPGYGDCEFAHVVISLRSLGTFDAD